MKTNGLVSLAVLGGLFLATPPASAITSDNPYLNTITNRNLFSLKAPPDPTLAPAPPAPPVPNVLLSGITTLMGGKKAVLRVPRPARPPEPAKEVSLYLGEGSPAEEGVRVLEINIAAGTVKIDNNGTVQTLDIEKNAPKTAAAPAAAPGATVPPLPNPRGVVPPPAPATTANPFGRPIRGAGPTAAGSEGITGAGPSGIAEPQAPPALTLEEQTIMIEANRLRTQKEVDAGDLPPLPPTDLTETIQQEQQGQQGQTPGLPAGQ